MKSDQTEGNCQTELCSGSRDNNGDIPQDSTAVGDCQISGCEDGSPTPVDDNGDKPRPEDNPDNFCKTCEDGGIVTDTSKNQQTLPSDECKVCLNGKAENLEITDVVAKANGEDNLTLPFSDSGVLVNFTGMADGAVCEFEYFWDFGNGQTSTEQNSSYSYGEAGVYDVTLKVKCKGCETIEKTDVIKVSVVTLTIESPVDNPTPNADIYESFLSNQRLEGTALYDGDDESLVEWTITPTIGQVTDLNPVDSKGLTISFQPLVTHPAYGTAGSRQMSQPLSYVYRVNVDLDGTPLEDSVTIRQDETDIIRQEYVNHSINIPGRNAFQTPNATANFNLAEINITPYSVVFGQPGELAQSVRDEYNVRIAQALQLSAPTNYGLNLNSAWRNPERNEIVGGVLNSNHQFGDAVDMSVLDSTVTATGLSKSQLYCILEAAGDAIGTGIPERGGMQVPCNNSTITHVHTQR